VWFYINMAFFCVCVYDVTRNLFEHPLSSLQDVIVSLSSPIKESGHIEILYGNVAPEGSVAKITGEVKHEICMPGIQIL
jgi:dihydroxyacid dehydratase/phosphogluconate dehydratase